MLDMAKLSRSILADQREGASRTVLSHKPWFPAEGQELYPRAKSNDRAATFNKQSKSRYWLS